MIFITGDTHGAMDFAKLRVFAKKNPTLTRDDYVIVAGDFGAVWNKATLEKDLAPYESLPYTVLFVDGNHENFTLLSEYPVEVWNGGKIHKISDNIIHLMRGQIYDICGKTFLTLGGATSIDRMCRTEGVSWWEEEVPSHADVLEAVKNLRAVNFKVDYIVTHSCDERALYYPPLNKRMFQTGTYPENAVLNYFEENVRYGHWYFGHYHLDGDLNENKTVVYDKIIKLED
ncbi:MAG: metallophosphoesterase [Clostridia bacterium]|nr:metallophosphoesterase [Clostridia bacterium]